MKKCDANIKCIYECKKPEVKNVLDSSLMFGAMYLQGSSSQQCFDGLIMRSWGGKAGAKSKCLCRGGGLSCNASKSRCPSLSGVSLYHSAVITLG